MQRQTRALLILPGLLFVLSILLVEKHGPYHLGQNFDPEYAYLLNSLNLLTLQSPGHIDHPGTTLQELGAVAIFGRWLALSATHGWESLQMSVLAHPEDYLRSINLLLNLLYCVLLYLVSRRLLQYTGSLIPPLVFQATFVLYQEILMAQTRVSPEPLLLTATLALVWSLLPAVLGPAPEAAARRPRTAIVSGVLFGFGVVTKVTFLPLAALALVLSGWRQRGRFALAACVSALAFLLPVLGQLDRIAGWLWSVLSHDGRYGAGEAGLPSLREYAGNLYQLLRAEPAIYLLLLLYVAVLVILWREERSQFDAPPGRFLLGAVLAAAGLMVIAGKHYAAHYVLPAFALTPAVSATVAALATSPRRGFPGKRVLLAGAAIMLFCFTLTTKSVDLWLHLMESYRRDFAEQQRDMAPAGDCRQAAVYRSSIPFQALHFGNAFSLGHHRDVLQELHPNALIYNTFDKQFEDLGFTPQDAEVRRSLQDGGCLLIQGTRETIEGIQGFRHEIVRDSLWEVSARLELPPAANTAEEPSL